MPECVRPQNEWIWVAGGARHAEKKNQWPVRVETPLPAVALPQADSQLFLEPFAETVTVAYYYQNGEWHAERSVELLRVVPVCVRKGRDKRRAGERQKQQQQQKK